MLRRVAGDYGPGRDIAHCDGARAYYRAFPDRHARTDKGIGANPGLITDGDRRFQQREVSLLMIMRPRAKMRPM